MNDYPNPRCYFCGRFISWKSPFWSWVPYGSADSLEPPDEEFAHEDCWSLRRDSQALIAGAAWLKPKLTDNSSRRQYPVA